MILTTARTKTITILIFLIFMISSVESLSKIHIWVDNDQKSQDWENELVKELRNSKYFQLFGNYTKSWEWQDISDNDYIIFIMSGMGNYSYYGSVDLYKVKTIENKRELISYAFDIYIYSKKIEWIYSYKNKIFEWIDEGITSK